ncbi:MAG: single-stranded DNA-binding protein [Elainella sp. Prado103]|jgi:single-stranded DNA-binding protein|nr:single-stranded DNA-binding protein [Elainella sp. Prado103]
MSSIGLNKWIVSGHLGATAQVKMVELRDGSQAKLAETTLYVRKTRDWKESFTVKLTIWERSAAWRKLPYLKKGSVIICTGNLEPNPYISSNGNIPRAGLEMTVVDVDLDNVKNEEERADYQPESDVMDIGKLENPFDSEVQAIEAIPVPVI